MPRPPTTGPASRGFLHLHLHEDELLTPQPLRWSPLVSQSGILSRFARTFARRGKGTSLNSTCLTPKPLASSVYVHVPEAPSSRVRSISVTSLLPSPLTRVSCAHFWFPESRAGRRGVDRAGHGIARDRCGRGLAGRRRDSRCRPR